MLYVSTCVYCGLTSYWDIANGIVEPGGVMWKNVLISPIPDIIQLNRVNSLLKFIQIVEHWPCCILVSILHPTLSFTIQHTDKQALSHTYRQMDRRSRHYSVRFLCKTTTMSERVRHTHNMRTLTHISEHCSWWKNSTANAVIQQSDRD